MNQQLWQKSQQLNAIWKAMLVAGVDYIFPVPFNALEHTDTFAYRRLLSTQRSAPWDPTTNIMDAVEVSVVLGLKVTARAGWEESACIYTGSNGYGISVNTAEDIFPALCVSVTDAAFRQSNAIDTFTTTAERAITCDNLSLIESYWRIAMVSANEFSYQKIRKVICREVLSLSERLGIDPDKDMTYRFHDALDGRFQFSIVRLPDGNNQKEKTIRVMVFGVDAVTKQYRRIDTIY